MITMHEVEIVWDHTDHIRSQTAFVVHLQGGGGSYVITSNETADYNLTSTVQSVSSPIDSLSEVRPDSGSLYLAPCLPPPNKTSSGDYNPTSTIQSVSSPIDSLSEVRQT